MTTGDEEHAHEHRVVEIIDSEAITAFEQVPHGIITLRFHERGVTLDLGCDEAVVLGTVIEKAVEHVKAKQQAQSE